MSPQHARQAPALRVVHLSRQAASNSHKTDICSGGFGTQKLIPDLAAVLRLPSHWR